MAKNTNAVTLKIKLDIMPDPEKVMEVGYRPLLPKESNDKALVDARTYYTNNFGVMVGLLDELDSITDGIEDIEQMLRMTQKPEVDDNGDYIMDDDNEYPEILREKVKLGKEQREVSRTLAKEIKAVQMKHPDFVDVTHEYGKIALIELEMRVTGKDGKALLKEAKANVSSTAVLKYQLDKAYALEVKGK